VIVNAITVSQVPHSLAIIGYTRTCLKKATCGVAEYSLDNARILTEDRQTRPPSSLSA
jgi:hypothetical protein